jgi:hypothetical protein
MKFSTVFRQYRTIGCARYRDKVTVLLNEEENKLSEFFFFLLVRLGFATVDMAWR